MIGIIDYGMGNVGSVQRMLQKLGVLSFIATQPTELKDDIQALIIPGVGAFDNAIDRLQATGHLTRLNELVIQKRIPVLGICLGMQLLFHESEEGKRPGLGWVKGKVVKFRFDEVPKLPIPHMGWCEVTFKANCGIMQNTEVKPRFYFVHSFHAIPNSEADVIGTAEYGYKFCCAVQRDNIVGVQFHPEKSHRFGMQLLNQFALHYECDRINRPS
jgi:glutamine amidotransferase